MLMEQIQQPRWCNSKNFVQRYLSYGKKVDRRFNDIIIIRDLFG